MSQRPMALQPLWIQQFEDATAARDRRSRRDRLARSISVVVAMLRKAVR